MKPIILTFLFLYVSLSVHAQIPEDYLYEEDTPSEQGWKFICGSKKQQGITYKYCFRDSRNTNSRDIVYFFHGLGGSEKTWQRQVLGTRVIQGVWDSHGYRPRIVSVSFGPQWLLVNNRKFPLIPFFTKVIMPTLERKMGGLKGGKRHLIGQSMGGFNGAEVSLKNPGMFSRVALLCPAFSTVSPFASQRDIDDYIYRTGARRDLVEKSLYISRSVFIDQNDWDTHDPLKLLEKYPPAKKPRFFVSIGKRDGYGFQEGAAAFIRSLSDLSYLFQWVPVPGGHCSFKRVGTAKFIMGD